MTNNNLDNLLRRYVTNQVSEQERIKIEAWLDVKKTQGDDAELSAQDEERLYQKIVANLDNVEEIVAFRPDQNRMRVMINTPWIRIAAAILLLAVLSYGVWYSVSSNKSNGGGAIGQFEKMILDDGSIVWLQAGSKLSYAADASSGVRRADLSGEALFEVTKDAAHPFMISCGEITVKVLGTSFRLKTEKDQVELEVLTGLVNLSSVKDAIGIDVKPHERTVYSASGVLTRTKIENSALTEVTAGTQYDMSFRNTEMSSVLDRIESKFDVVVTVADAELDRCRITGDFTDQSLEVTLEMISELLGVEYKISGKSVAISGKGCR